MKKIVSTVLVVGMLSACTPKKTTPEFVPADDRITYAIDGAPVILDGASNGKGSYIYVSTAREGNINNHIVFDVRIKNASAMSMNVPKFRASSAGEVCDLYNINNSKTKIEKNQTYNANINWLCGVHLNRNEIELTTVVGGSILTWIRP